MSKFIIDMPLVTDATAKAREIAEVLGRLSQSRGLTVKPVKPRRVRGSESPTAVRALAVSEDQR